jgi:DNA primase
MGMKPRPLKGKLEKSHNLLKTRIGRAKGNEPVATFLEELILLAVLNHPKLAHDHFEDLSSLVFHDQDLAKLQKEILDFSHEQHEINLENLKEHLLNLGFTELYKRLSERSAVRNVRFAKQSSTFELAEKWWHKTLSRLQLISNLRKDFEELEKDYMENPDEQKWQRLTAIKTEIDKIVLNEEYMKDYELDSTSNMII